MRILACLAGVAALLIGAPAALAHQGKPYVRSLRDGTVQVNTNSQAYYLDVDRYGQVSVPKGLGAVPSWKVVGRDGRYDWHDHRIRWMSQSDPPGLEAKDRAQKIDDWTVPIQVDGRRGAIKGTLSWVPLPNAPLPVGAIFTFAALVIVLSIVVLAVRRRRAAPAPEEVAEAW